MSFGDDWRAIAARISGLRVAGELSAHFQAINSSDDSYGSGAELGAQCKDIVSKLREFEERYRVLLPKSAAEALARFLQLRVVKGLVTETDGNRAVRSGLPALVGFESELTFHLSGQQERIKARAERAFQHLQQIIVADEDARSKWQAAFGKSEPAVERLGGTHLLWHGVYAFKVVAEKAQTDLVFNNLLTSTQPHGPVRVLCSRSGKLVMNRTRARNTTKHRRSAICIPKGRWVA